MKCINPDCEGAEFDELTSETGVIANKCKACGTVSLPIANAV
jgi:uncharacterized OB-fold protein